MGIQIDLNVDEIYQFLRSGHSSIGVDDKGRKWLKLGETSFDLDVILDIIKQHPVSSPKIIRSIQVIQDLDQKNAGQDEQKIAEIGKAYTDIITAIEKREVVFQFQDGEKRVPQSKFAIVEMALVNGLEKAPEEAPVLPISAISKKQFEDYTRLSELFKKPSLSKGAITLEELQNFFIVGEYLQSEDLFNEKLLSHLIAQKMIPDLSKSEYLIHPLPNLRHRPETVAFFKKTELPQPIIQRLIGAAITQYFGIQHLSDQQLKGLIDQAVQEISLKSDHPKSDAQLLTAVVKSIVSKLPPDLSSHSIFNNSKIPQQVVNHILTTTIDSVMYEEVAKAYAENLDQFSGTKWPNDSKMIIALLSSESRIQHLGDLTAVRMEELMTDPKCRKTVQTFVAEQLPLLREKIDRQEPILGVTGITSILTLPLGITSLIIGGTVFLAMGWFALIPGIILMGAFAVSWLVVGNTSSLQRRYEDHIKKLDLFSRP